MVKKSTISKVKLPGTEESAERTLESVVFYTLQSRSDIVQILTAFARIPEAQRRNLLHVLQGR